MLTLTDVNRLDELNLDELKRELERYVMHRLQPGDFLAAVLANDLKRSIAYGGRDAETLLGDLVRYILSETPAECRGSQEKVQRWLANREAR
jgi:hypothetical protein